MYPLNPPNDDASVYIDFEQVDNASNLTNVDNNISNRWTETGQKVTWHQDDLGTGQVSSPDLSAPLQAIISRPGWVSGNNIVLLFDHLDTNGNNLRIESYGDVFAAEPEKIPRLEITYTYTKSIGDGNPFYGWAWNDNIGWLSFNCQNDLSCGASNYAVTAEDNLDLTANLTGCAWSESVGRLCFDPASSTPNITAMLDLSTNEVSGWARFCSLAADTDNCRGDGGGWVKMRCDIECGASGFGVYMAKDQSLHGRAYSDDYGWLSFNCEEGGPVGPVGQEWCATSSYHAAMETNITGWAYSSVTDWISFNCNNEIECGSSTYGVHLDYNTKTLAGYAYSDNVGWISFQEGSLPGGLVNYNFNTNCQNTCDDSNNCTACLDTNGDVYGWAKVLSYGDNGWIKFNDSTAPAYKVELIGTDFEGWAWNGSDSDVGAGWISFNCNDGGPGDICPPISLADYKVTYGEYFTYNQIPTTTDETAGLLVIPCNYAVDGSSVRHYTLGWTFEDPDGGDSQNGYQIVIHQGVGGPTPPGIPDFDTGKCVVLGGDCVVGPGGSNFNLSSLTINPVAYGNTYSWWVKVWDNNGGESDWQTGDGFTVESNEYPDPRNFTITPSDFSAGEEVLFESRDMGIYYNGNTPNACNTINCQWLWDENPDLDKATFDGSLVSSATSSSIIIFSDTTPTVIRLQLTSGGNTCETATSTNPNVRLPSWIETR